MPLVDTEADDADFSGEWDSTWGTVMLYQEGDGVTGTYSYEDLFAGMVYGSIEGTVSGNQLDFGWEEDGVGYGTGYFLMYPEATLSKGNGSSTIPHSGKGHGLLKNPTETRLNVIKHSLVFLLLFCNSGDQP